jgi:hypothetical protein
MQRVVHKGTRGLVGKVWQRNGHRRENRAGEGCAFQDARGSLEIALCIAAGTAGHIGLIGHRRIDRGWRDDGFCGCGKYGNRNCNQSDKNRSDYCHS